VARCRLGGFSFAVKIRGIGTQLAQPVLPLVGLNTLSSGPDKVQLPKTILESLVPHRLGIWFVKVSRTTTINRRAGIIIRIGIVVRSGMLLPVDRPRRSEQRARSPTSSHQANNAPCRDELCSFVHVNFLDWLSGAGQDYREGWRTAERQSGDNSLGPSTASTSACRGLNWRKSFDARFLG